MTIQRFKAHYLGLPIADRDALADRAGTTRGMLNQVVYGGKEIELGLADCLVALCPGITLDDLPLTDRAKKQHQVRSSITASAEAVLSVGA
jgi:hypothetical protein